MLIIIEREDKRALMIYLHLNWTRHVYSLLALVTHPNWLRGMSSACGSREAEARKYHRALSSVYSVILLCPITVGGGD